MKFDYGCKTCGRSFTIDSDKEPDLPACPVSVCGSAKTMRMIKEKRSRSRVKIKTCNITIMGGKIEDAEYNPGLGCVTKSKRHREEICKAKGLYEIGNDYKSPDDIHNSNDKALAEKRQKAWDSV